MEGTNPISTPRATSWQAQALLAAKQRLAELARNQPRPALFGDAALDLLELGNLIVAEIKAAVVASDDKVGAFVADAEPLADALKLHRQAERHEHLVEKISAKAATAAT